MGSKEEKHIVIEFQKKILQEAGCSAEVIAFLDEIEDEVFCEYYCFCFLDGMPIEEVTARCVLQSLHRLHQR